ncbi:MAG: hypothetical protein ACI4ED_08580 [Suilimivivens sp.]
MNKKNEGVTTIVVVCVMAIIMALSLGLFLTASVLMKTATRTAASEQCRILAVTLSDQVEKQLTGEETQYESRLEENAAKAEDIHNISLWHYIKQEITDGSWPYYEEPGSSLHSGENAIRSFQMDSSGIAGEIAATTLSIYWIHGKDEKIPEQLVVKTQVTVKEQSCTITDVYRLRITLKDDYESWKWEHVDRK